MLKHCCLCDRSPDSDSINLFHKIAVTPSEKKTKDSPKFDKVCWFARRDQPVKHERIHPRIARRNKELRQMIGFQAGLATARASLGLKITSSS